MITKIIVSKCNNKIKFLYRNAKNLDKKTRCFLPPPPPPSRKNLNLTEKLLLPKNSITITETISNTRAKSQPLPENSQSPVKNSQSLPIKSQPLTP